MKKNRRHMSGLGSFARTRHCLTAHVSAPGAAFEDPLFAVQGPASPDTEAEAFLPPHEFVRAKLEQSAPVAGCVSAALEILHLSERFQRPGGHLGHLVPKQRADAAPAGSCCPKTNVGPFICASWISVLAAGGNVLRPSTHKSARICCRFFSHVERGVNKTRVLHTRNAIMRATGFLDTAENRGADASSVRVERNPFPPCRPPRNPLARHRENLCLL